jgi:membrane-associated phospholipid phosphatase
MWWIYKMMDVVEKIGMYGHLLMFGIVSLYLFYMKSALWGYWIGSAINEIVVLVLKRVLKEPRPKLITTDVNAPEYYGMPSGHTQHTVFSVVYLGLMNANPIWLMCLGLLSCFAIYERIINQKHSVRQVIVGGILGILMAGIVYKLTKMYYESDHNKLVFTEDTHSMVEMPESLVL